MEKCGGALLLNVTSFCKIFLIQILIQYFRFPRAERNVSLTSFHKTSSFLLEALLWRKLQKSQLLRLEGPPETAYFYHPAQAGSAQDCVQSSFVYIKAGRLHRLSEHLCWCLTTLTAKSIFLCSDWMSHFLICAKCLLLCQRVLRRLVFSSSLHPISCLYRLINKERAFSSSSWKVQLLLIRGVLQSFNHFCALCWTHSGKFLHQLH